MHIHTEQLRHIKHNIWKLFLFQINKKDLTIQA